MNPIKILTTVMLAVTDVNSSVNIPASVSQAVYFNAGTKVAYLQIGAAAVVPAVGAPGAVPIASGAYFTVTLTGTTLATRAINAVCATGETATVFVMLGWGE